MTRLTLAVVALMSVLSLDSSRLDSSQLVVVRGRVVPEEDAAHALRGARIVLTGTSATADPVVTDGEGRFALGGPAAATLRITKAGYAPAIVRIRDMGADDVQIRLARGAVITGRVADKLGFPAVNAGIRARRVDPTPEESAGDLIEFTTESDDRGEFRIGSLPPGRYTVHSEPPSIIHDAVRMFHSENDFFRLPAMLKAMRPPTPMSDAIAVTTRAGDEADVSLIYRLAAVAPSDAAIGGIITGTVVDEFGDPAESLSVRAWRLRYADGVRVAEPAGVFRRSDDRGEYRLFHLPPGRYLVSSGDDDPRWAATYHPDATVISGAAPVTVLPRQQTSGAHIRHSRTRHARVSGTVRTTNGVPFDGTVMLTQRSRPGSVVAPLLTLANGGAFEFPAVPAGEYVVRAVTGSAGRSELAVQPVVISGSDISPLNLVTAPTADLSGRIVLEGAVSSGDEFPFGIVAVPDPDYVPFNARRSTGVVRDDLTFEIRGLVGPTRFALVDGPPGWWLKSVDIRGVNAAEESVTFSGERDSRDDVTVVLSATAASVTGRVRADDARPIDDFRVVLFSTRRDRWFAASPYVRMTGGPEGDGGFTFRSVRPGEYYIIAVSQLEGDGASGEWQDPEVLERFALNAARITAGERQHVTADLPLVHR